MQKLTDFYTQERSTYRSDYTKIKKQLRLLSMARLLVFVAIAILLFLFWENAKVVLGSLFGGLALFLLLVKFYEEAKTKANYTQALIQINQTELNVLANNLEELPNGSQYMDAEHPYSHDLDIFGEGSFFQYLNRTQLQEAQDVLADLITANNIEAIGAKQETVDELAQNPKWRQSFAARAAMVDQEVHIATEVAWLNSYKSFVPQNMRVLPKVFLLGSALLGFLTYQYPWGFNLLVFWIILGLGLTARFGKQIRQLSQKADRVKGLFRQYAQLLEILEETEFKAPQLRFQKQRLFVGDQKASEAIGQFSRLLNTMDYNNNIFYIIFGNGCFLGALWTARNIEAWIAKYKGFVADWFHVIAFFEAHNSLGNFSFNHPLYAYPMITDGPAVLSCEKLGHPLIAADRNVKNDFGIDDEDFYIITGSNMAGKSTFLRSVGLCVIMANLGLPVHADACLYSPRKLVTSMRSVDSLYKGDSYFLSELKRLKKVIELLQEGPHFVLLDEILKGTNSTDKANGSKRFLARLIKAHATGIIATHDLSLCETADAHDNVFNFHLDATIANNELHFDYLLKQGVSKTMNASFLLEKMDLV